MKKIKKYKIMHRRFDSDLEEMIVEELLTVQSYRRAEAICDIMNGFIGEASFYSKPIYLEVIYE